MSGSSVAAILIVLLTAFVVLDLTGNIDWGGAGTIYHTYQFLIWPLAAVIVIAGVIAYAVRNS